MGDSQTPSWSGDSGPGTALYAREAVFTLLHTMAHQMLRAISVDSGFGEAALSEYLFPYDFAFAIYPNASSEFTIGGLRTVMEQVLGEVVSGALENDACLYDPNCIETEGADHGCLFLPETSCTGWNQNLTRWVLFGGDDFQSVIGKWTESMSRRPTSSRAATPAQRCAQEVKMFPRTRLDAHCSSTDQSLNIHKSARATGALNRERSRCCKQILGICPDISLGSASRTTIRVSRFSNGAVQVVQMTCVGAP